MNLPIWLPVKSIALRSLSLLLFCPSVFINLYSQNIPSYSCEMTYQSNNIRHYLMNEAAKISGNTMAGINTLEDWEKVKPTRYNQLVEMLGMQDMPLSDERSNLNVKVTGIIKKDGYRIEKLYYESLPGLYVAANLYVPDNITEPRPAILYVCGHSFSQKVNYQEHPRKFAQLGFVCLIIETIQWGEVRGVHHGSYAKGWFNWYSRGYNPAGVEVWNGIRGIDLLVERLEVDPEKIGVTGNSGGGSQSWYLPAIDQRIRVAAPSCGASTLKAQIATRSIDDHCDCMMPINTYGWDFQDIGALIAPRPILVGQSNRDALNQIESVRQIHDDLYKSYEWYGKPENNRFIEYPGAHGYQPISRKTIFSFFLEQLMDKNIPPKEISDTDKSSQIQLSDEELEVYVDGAPEDDRTSTIQDSFVKLAQAPDISNRIELQAHKDSVVNFLLMKTFGAFPKEKCPLTPQLVFRSQNRAGQKKDTYSFVSEEGWYLKLDFHWNYDRNEVKPLMIVLRNAEEEQGASENFIRDYLKEGWNVAFLEVRGVGETGWNSSLQWHVRRASAWTGRTIASMQVYDVLRCLDFCRTITGVDDTQIGIATQDEMGAVALYASLLDGGISDLLLKNPPESQNVTSSSDGRGPAIEMLNCLRVTDVNQIPALIPSTKIEFVETIPDAYRWAGNTLSKIGADPLEIVKAPAKYGR